MEKFNDIFLKEKTVTASRKKGYNIYKDKTNFVFVEADTAAEAIEKSDVKSPYKIICASLTKKALFSSAELAEIQKSPPAMTPVPEPSVPETPEAPNPA